jgi:DNA-directed RNA polymerase subunit RPC12/RpoP
MTTITRFRYLDDLHLAVAFLESHGIRCFAPEENLVRMHWFYCQAVGDLRLQTFDEDAEMARELLRAHALSETRAQCPQCGSAKVVRERFGKWNVASMLLLWVPAKPNTDRIVCRDCRHRVPAVDIAIPKPMDARIEAEALSRPFVDVPPQRLPGYLYFMGGVFCGILAVSVILPLMHQFSPPQSIPDTTDAFVAGTLGGGLIGWLISWADEVREKAFK